jgi:hypothetical protein
MIVPDLVFIKFVPFTFIEIPFIKAASELDAGHSRVHRASLFQRTEPSFRPDESAQIKQLAQSFPAPFLPLSKSSSKPMNSKEMRRHA